MTRGWPGSCACETCLTLRGWSDIYVRVCWCVRARGRGRGGRQMNVTKRGAQCNRAIMIITDGAPDYYEEIFEEFNRPYEDVRATLRISH